MKRRTAATALALGALVVASSGEPGRVGLVPVARHLGRPAAPAATPVPPVPPVPTIVTTADAPATRGWSRTTAPTLPGPGDALAAAYAFAVAAAPEHCHLDLSLLAAIGQVESGNAAGRTLDSGNRVVPAIVGPALDGKPYAAIRDTDGGTLDHDLRWDHAVGPFQFIPSSWRVAGVDFDGDGVRDPQDVYDAAGAAMVYLCADGRDLQDPAQLEAAVLAYNHSRTYLRLVLHWQAVFASGSSWASVRSTPALAAIAAPAGRPAGPHAAHEAGQHAPASGGLDPVALHAEPQLPGASSRPPAPLVTGGSLEPAPAAVCPSPTEPAAVTPTDAPTGTPTDAPTATATAAPTDAATAGPTPAPDPTVVPDPSATPDPGAAPSHPGPAPTSGPAAGCTTG